MMGYWHIIILAYAWHKSYIKNLLDSKLELTSFDSSLQTFKATSLLWIHKIRQIQSSIKPQFLLQPKIHSMIYGSTLLRNNFINNNKSRIFRVQSSYLSLTSFLLESAMLNFIVFFQNQQKELNDFFMTS